VQSPPATVVNAGFIRTPVAPEQPAGNDVFCIQRNFLANPPGGVGDFVGKLELIAAGQLLSMQNNGAWQLTGLPGLVGPPPPAPVLVCPPGAATFTPNTAIVSTMAVAPSAAATDQWVGTDQGELW